ncbi:aldolase [Sphingobium sp. SCG-1]|uniref:HPr kinase/phosphorylase n=1 Tax=Sphingobium sp. SCG-1 TaxID=2072936 RepID=UPI000CD6C53E|nr:HPr kinase/phosphatase C-terminal domain-containing protein [Sphingobium sp. SCG-1]AUW58886.1 aldolase [Sphingobium sp. SCG-1]
MGVTGESQTLHATSVAIEGRAVLLMGLSGSGKSDLALRLIDRGGKLVSDDYTVLTRLGETLMASAPDRIAGKIEVRGVGIVEMELVAAAPVAVILNLGAEVERYPGVMQVTEIAGIAIPTLPLSPWEASAPIKVALALRAFGLATDGDGVAAAS